MDMQSSALQIFSKSYIYAQTFPLSYRYVVEVSSMNVKGLPQWLSGVMYCCKANAIAVLEYKIGFQHNEIL